MSPLILENADLRLACHPQFGGKFFSLIERATGTEFLLPPATPYLSGSADGGFEDSDRGGFDECLPSVAACSAGEGHPDVPDHGELWRTAWEVETSSANELRLSALCPLSELRLVRSATLEGTAVTLHYRLTNVGREARSWLWSAHPLLLVEPGDRILLPDDIREARVECSLAGEWGAGERIPWPHAQRQNGSTVDLGRVPPPDGRTGNKFFVQMDTEGWCALHRKRAERLVVFRFDPRELPYLGIWTCLGGWPAARDPKQYTVALEPTTSDRDSLAHACANGSERWLNPGETAEWQLRLDILPEGKRPFV